MTVFKLPRPPAGKIAAASLAAILFGLTLASPSGAIAENHIVSIEGFQFVPAEITVSVGDTVTWVNLDVAPHTATADDGSFDSGSLSQDDEWSVVIETAGEFDYICLFHPQMQGVITAE